MNILQDLNCEMIIMIARNGNKNIFGFYRHFFLQLILLVWMSLRHFLSNKDFTICRAYQKKNAWFLGKYNTITSTSEFNPIQGLI